MPEPQQPLELILARNLIATISLAAFLIDPHGELVFFNECAGEQIGRRFEEVGRLNVEEWSSRVGPFDELGKLLPAGDLPIAEALRHGLPATGHFRARLAGELKEIEATGLPLVGVGGLKGAIIVFWESSSDRSGD